MNRFIVAWVRFLHPATGSTWSRLRVVNLKNQRKVYRFFFLPLTNKFIEEWAQVKIGCSPGESTLRLIKVDTKLNNSFTSLRILDRNSPFHFMFSMNFCALMSVEANKFSFLFFASSMIGFWDFYAKRLRRTCGNRKLFRMNLARSFSVDVLLMFTFSPAFICEI